MANSSNVYENPSLSRGIELKGFKSQKNTEEEYYSTIDDVKDSETKVDTVPAQQGDVKDVKVKLTEHVTSSIPTPDIATNDKYGSTPKSNVKLVIILISVMIAIAAASSTVTALFLKKDLKIIQEELSAFKQDTLKVDVWSAWSHWGLCSATCNGGTRTRNRTCNIPGHDKAIGMCTGNDVDISACSYSICTVDVWSQWLAWGDCSVSCNGGIRTRNRTCNIPGQDKAKGFCTGNDVDISTCSPSICTDSFVIPTIMFKAKTVTDKAPTAGQVLVFSTNLYNVGEGYNTDTGVFTTPMTGLYHFTVQICTYKSAKITIRLLLDDNAILINTIGGAEWRHCSSADASVVMTKGKKAWVVANYIHDRGDNDFVLENSSYRVNAFSGLLIHL